MTNGEECAIVQDMSEERKYFDTEEDTEGKGMVINTEGDGEEQEVVLVLEDESSDEKDNQKESN